VQERIAGTATVRTVLDVQLTERFMLLNERAKGGPHMWELRHGPVQRQRRARRVGECARRRRPGCEHPENDRNVGGQEALRYAQQCVHSS
jgi:hypothetical protein